MSLRNHKPLLYLLLLLDFLILILLQNAQSKQTLAPINPYNHTGSRRGIETAMNPVQLVLPSTGPLTKWFQTRMEMLLTSAPGQSQQPPSITKPYPTKPETEVDFKSLFYGAFHPDATVTVNHKSVTQEDFIRQMEQNTMGLGPGGVQVEWREVLEVPDGQEAGIVAGMFIATRSLKFRIRAGPAQRHSFNVFSARIQTAKPVKEAGVDEEHPYLIADLILTTHEQAAPVHMPGIRAPVQTVSMKDVEKHPMDGEGK